MKKTLINYAPILIGLTALADTNFELLLQIGLNSTAIAWIKFIGLIIALFLPSVSKKINIMSRQLDNTDPTRTDFPKGTKV
jgi:hypothetical protein